jgi:nucleoside diphosphate kinase
MCVRTHKHSQLLDAKVGNIIGRFESKGYKLVAMKMMTPTKV